MRTWIPLLALLLLAGGCRESDTAKMIEDLKAQVRADQEMLRVDAETRDPARKNLKATFVDTSVMSVRPTSNPERPYVGYVRIQWRFEYTDGRPLGDAVFDYVYARTPDKRWIKADEAEIESDAPRAPAGDGGPSLPSSSAGSPSPA